MRMPHSSVRNQHQASRGSSISSVNRCAWAGTFRNSSSSGAALLRRPAKDLENLFIGELSGEEDLHQRRAAAAIHFQRRGQPAVQFFAARLGDAVNLAVGAVFLLDHLHLGVALLVELGQDAVDLALIGRPEVLDREIEPFLEVIARQRPILQEPQNRVIQRHGLPPIYDLSYIGQVL